MTALRSGLGQANLSLIRLDYKTNNRRACKEDRNSQGFDSVILRSGPEHATATVPSPKYNSIQHDMPARKGFETVSKFASSGVLGWCFFNTL